MKEELKRLLEDIVKENGTILYDTEYMVCRSCGAEALGTSSLGHKDDCVFTRAKKMLGTETESVKQAVKDYIKKYPKGSSISFLEVDVNSKTITIEYGGNMGSSIKRSVNPLLKEIGLPTVEEIRNAYPGFKEDGEPDYSWYITFRIF